MNTLTTARHRLVLAEDHCVVRDLLKDQLHRLTPARYEVVDEGGTGQEVVDACLRSHPDLLLLDLMLPGLNGVEVLRRVAPKLPRLRTLVFSGTTIMPLIIEAFGLGIAGFISKPRPWPTVLHALDVVAEGGKYVDAAVAGFAGKLTRHPPVENLTAREREVAQMIAEGHSTKEIGSLLRVSPKTIDKHRTRMMDKLHLHDAVSVTRYAIQAGLVSLD